MRRSAAARSGAGITHWQQTKVNTNALKTDFFMFVTSYYTVKKLVFPLIEPQPMAPGCCSSMASFADCLTFSMSTVELREARRAAPKNLQPW